MLFQDPSLIPGPEILKYGTDGILYMVLAAGFAAAIYGVKILTKSITKIGTGIENSIDRQATASEKGAVEQARLNRHLELFMQQARSDTERVLQQHETSTAIIIDKTGAILDKLDRNEGRSRQG